MTTAPSVPRFTRSLVPRLTVFCKLLHARNVPGKEVRVQVSTPSVGRRQQMLEDLPLLARLPRNDVRALAAHGRLRTYAEDAAVFAQGDVGDCLHVVVEGRIRLSVLSEDGKEVLLAVLGPGEAVGELSLLDGRPRSASATAEGAAKTLVVNRADFLAWLSATPSSALAVLQTLSLRLRQTDAALADLAFLDLRGRLAKRLVSMAEPRAAATDGGETSVTATQSELAAMLGVSRESVNKELNRFARCGWLRLERGRVVLLDAAALLAGD